jgi:hypothetical protein
MSSLCDYSAVRHCSAEFFFCSAGARFCRKIATAEQAGASAEQKKKEKGKRGKKEGKGKRGKKREEKYIKKRERK